MARMKRPVLSDVTVDSLTDFQTADETVFLAYLNPGDCQSQRAFSDIAQRYSEEFTFGVAVSDLEPPSGITPPAVICYKPVDGEVTSFSFASKIDELENWILEASPPP
jgi:protein disulfide-isomerase A1